MKKLPNQCLFYGNDMDLVSKHFDPGYDFDI